MSEIDQQFLEYVVKSLVGNPEAVHIDRRVDDKGVLLELTVDPNDLGRVIGKRGVTAQSLRTLLRALGMKNDARYNLKIIDNGTGDHAPRDESNNDSHQPAAQEELHKPESAAEEAMDKVFVEKSEPEVMAETPKESRVDAEPKKPAVVEEASDRMAQTRRELAEFDDLDL